MHDALLWHLGLGHPMLVSVPVRLYTQWILPFSLANRGQQIMNPQAGFQAICSADWKA